MKDEEKMGLGTFLVRTCPWCKFSSYSWSSACPKLHPNKCPPPPPPKKYKSLCHFDQSFQQCYCGRGNKGKMPGSWNTGNVQETMSVRGVSNPSQALPVLRPLKSSSRYPAAMEETCAKSIPYSFKVWHSWVRWLTESEILFLHKQFMIMFKWHPIHCTCIVLICVYNFLYNVFRATRYKTTSLPAALNRNMCV
jgi:hypothetical protein